VTITDRLPTGATVTVACAHRYELARLGVARITRRYPDLQLVGEAATLAEVPGMLARTRPAVLVIGDDPSPEGRRFLAGIRAAHPELGVVVVSHHTEDARCQQFRDAAAFVSRSAPVEQVLAAIRHAATAPARFRTFGVPWTIERKADRTPALSQRERQVLDLLRDGRRAEEMAETLQVGRGTIRTHVTRLYAKLGVSNRSQALVASHSG
jgi:DNA-binding NarL/FixJ family response regulator